MHERTEVLPVNIINVIIKMIFCSTIVHVYVDWKTLPLGEKCSVASPNDAFDFTKPKPIGQDIAKVPGGGYDHNYCLPKSEECCAE